MRARSMAVLAMLVLGTGCGSEGGEGGSAGSGGGSAATGGAGGAGGSGAASGGSSGGGQAGSAATSGSGGSGATGGSSGEWQTLIEGSWQVTSGDEKYWCVTKTLTEDLYVRSFRPLAPDGTHHTLVLYGGGGPDGASECGPTIADSMIFASGVGTDDLTFPEGVALKLAAGSQIMLNLHLFNTGADTITGTSGTLIQVLPADQVQQEAEMILPGTMSIAIPPQSEHTVIGDCTFPGTATISTVFPHMHKYGKHMKVVHESASGDTTLHDGPYSFYEQKNYAITPRTVHAGETIRVECTYQNTTNQTITWGDSSEKEMCFAGLYRYPKLSSGCQ